MSDLEHSVPRSRLADWFWPAIPAEPAATLLALLHQLEESQWWSADRLKRAQMEQLQGLVQHATRHVPYYRDILPTAMDGPMTEAAFRELPVLTRDALHEHFEAMRSEHVPPQHGETRITSTSGSTGKPVRVLQTVVMNHIAAALTLREHQWHARDVSGKLAAIHLIAKDRTAYPGYMQSEWGWPTSTVYTTGDAALLSVQTSVAQQLDWLCEFNPDYLLTLASNLDQLLEESARLNRKPQHLRGITALGEVLSDVVRARCKSEWNVTVVNNYSTREAGAIAMQCPQNDTLHVCAEGVYVEVLREDGGACKPGEIGRVVVTPLHNFAMPLIRYELGDYAEVGGICECGRGLPVLTRIVGRQYNLLRLPDGSRVWPSFGRTRMVKLAPIRQHQFIQTGPATIEARLVIDRPLQRTEEEQLLALWRERLPPGFSVRLNYVNDIPRSDSGKYEYFRCDWASPER